MSITARGAGRRLFLQHSLRHGVQLAAVGGMAAVVLPARASLAPRTLAFAHTHTGEEITLTYAQAHQYLPDALARLDHFLRDHYTGDVGHMDPALFDQLFRLQQVLGVRGAFEVISGYRCAGTNNRLRQTGGGGVARHSLHMEGRAIDVRLPGVGLAQLREAALSLRAGGVGYYPTQRFVHVDTGRVRSW